MQGRRKRHITARIKPATKHALMAQLALAADEIERLRAQNESLISALRFTWPAEWQAPRPWWRRLLGLR